MKKGKDHTDATLEKLFQKASIPYAKSKEEVWENLEQKLDGQDGKDDAKVIPFINWRAAVAVAAILVVTVSTYLFFYTKEIISPNGKHLAFSLPDGSGVELNAGSKASYRPYQWWFNRKITFEGEGFFNVQKGKTFTVVSPTGSTEVLGTSFNIYAREQTYKVYCATGQVKVSGGTASIIISPGEQVVFNEGNQSSVARVQTDDVAGWRDDKFNFVSVPLKLVLAELERQYAVTIEDQLHYKQDYVYSGYFDKKLSIEGTLSLVCKTFGLVYEKNNQGHYVIRKN